MAGRKGMKMIEDTEFTIKIKVSVGAGGTEFAALLLDAIEKGRDEVYMQVAGEYGHLRVEALYDFDTRKGNEQ
jgi:hypothetical protein